MTRQILEEMIGTPPPSTVDVAAVVRRERRTRTARWTGVAAVAALTLGALAAVPVLGAGDRSDDIAGPGHPASAPADPAADGFRLLAGNREDAEASAARLSRELDRALGTVAPGAAWLRQDLYGRPTLDGQPPNLFAPESAEYGEFLFNGGSGVAFEGRRGTLALEVLSPLPCAADNAKCAAERADPAFAERMREHLMTCAAPGGCEYRTGPKGERILTASTSSRPPRADRALVRYEVRIRLADGRVLMLATANQFTEPGGDKDAIAQDVPPLAMSHLVAIASAVAATVLA
jgi:hypothetical protein